MPNFSGWPWYAQLIGLIVTVLVVVFLWNQVIFPLIKTIT